MQKDRIGVVGREVRGRHLHLLLLEGNQDHDVAQEMVLLLVQPRSEHLSIIFTHVIMFFAATTTQLCITFQVPHRAF